MVSAVKKWSTRSLTPVAGLSWVSASGPCCRNSHTEPRSAVRSELKVQKSFHCSGPVKSAGMLATTQASTAPLVVATSWAQRRRRRQSTKMPPSSSSGNSFTAVPSPIITPVSTGRSRAQAQSAPATKTTASRSQFTRPVRARAGASAKPAASQGRRRLTPASSTVDSSATRASPIALTAT